MTMIISASSIFFNLPPGVAYLIDGKPVTYKELGERKRNKQRESLEWKRRSKKQIKIPVVIWVFDNDINKHSFFAGRYTYIYGRDQRRYEWAVNFRQSYFTRYAKMVMSIFPMGFLPMPENFDDWMKLFIKTYFIKPTKKDPRPCGKQFAWAWCSPGGIDLIKLEPRQ